ncbi:MAG: ABC transporter permease [Methanobacteriaceae archaeon]
MSFLSLVVKNPFRNKTRSALAITGIAIGIMVIVALGMVTGGLKTSTQSTLKAGAAEITVFQTGSGNSGTLGTIDENRVADIQKLSGVKDAAGTLRATNTSSSGISGGTGAPSSSGPSGGAGGGGFGGFSITGMDPGKLNLAGIDSVNGTLYSNGSANEVIIGKTAANEQNKKVGDTINLFGKDFKITGIYESGNFMTDGGAFMSLSTLQNLTNNTNKVSSIAVKINDNSNVTGVSNEIENAYPNQLSTTTAAASANRVNNALSTVDTASWAISILAVVIGGVGVINTMIMSVYERTREIGVLKAVGWKERRILGMILGESVVLTLIAAVVGTIVAVVGVEILFSVTSIGGTIKPSFGLDIFLRGFLVAFAVGIVGGLYPAYRASRLAPTEALRYE